METPCPMEYKTIQQQRTRNHKGTQRAWNGYLCITGKKKLRKKDRG